ncbi:MAG: transglycosylase domain-containing protein [Bacteroidota bacterium]
MRERRSQHKKLGRNGRQGPGRPHDTPGRTRGRRSGTAWRFVVFAAVVTLLTAFALVRAFPLPAEQIGSVFYDIRGEEITSTVAGSRIEVPLSAVAPHLRAAIVAVEDERFYRHPGIDPIGIARALVRNIRAGRIVEGGSTITQQLAKNMFLPPERTIARKIAELFLTFYLELKFSKDEILERYLNLVYLGHGAYGVEAGARLYFGKSARDVTLGEAAMLAGLTRGPFYYSPYRDVEAALDRREVVLDKMVSAGYITRSQARAAAGEPLELVGLGTREIGAAPYFVDYVMGEVLRRLGDGGNLLYSGGLKVYTTLDMSMQRAAEKAFAAGLDALTPEKPAGPVVQPQGALVAIDPTNGHVRALIGGRSFRETQFNRATQAKRQPGSAFKPFFYAAALDGGFTAATTLACEPLTFWSAGTPYTPTDYGEFDYHFRLLTLREALVVSCNVASVQLANVIGPEKGAEYAKRLGIKSRLRPHLSLVLGTSEVTPLEMAAAFAPFANGGKSVEPVFIVSVKDRRGRELLRDLPRVRQVLDPRTAFIVTDILKQVISKWGTAAGIADKVTRPAAGKTGSTQSYTDAWFVGYTPDLVCSVYVGYDDPATPLGRSGGAAAAPIWAAFVGEALAGKAESAFRRPPGIVSREICHETGFLATPGCPSTRWELFKQEAVPTEACPWHGTAPVTGGSLQGP